LILMRPAFSFFALIFVVTAGAASDASGFLEEDSGISSIPPAEINPYILAYEEIDSHALSAPATARASVKSLAAYLTKPAKNDREKARAIFRWIAANIDYDVQVFFKGGSGLTAAGDVLKRGKSVCYGYSDLFLALAEEAGLQAVMIRGYGKGYGYQPGQHFSGPSNHAWNAVLINGSWYLIDTTWGAGYVSGGGKYVRHFDDHYFMTPPSQFIYDHLPEDSSWQLLDSPISKEQFESLPYLESDFFNLGLELAGSSRGVIDAAGRANLSIYAPDGVLMTAGLEYAADAGGRTGLARRTFCQRQGGRYEILAELPEEGRYVLTAYGKRKGDSGEYSSVMEIGINASCGEDEGSGFPLAYSAFSRAGAYLFSPMQGGLKAGESYWFRIRVPGAQQVAVVSGEEWSYLTSRDGVFEGNATINEDNVNICAKFQTGSFDCLLRYFAR